MCLEAHLRFRGGRGPIVAGIGVHSPGRSDAGSATDEIRTRYKIHGSPECACGKRVDGQYWILVDGTFECACEQCASAYGDPRITPRSNRRVRVS